MLFARRIASSAARAAGGVGASASRVPVRFYAAQPNGQAASSAAQVKPPVALFGIDGTYASALYTAAAKSSALEPTAKALDTLGAIFKKDRNLQQVLAAPTLSVEDKKQIIAELQKQIGGADKNGVIRNFLETLAENNRLGVLDGVCEKFAQLMSAHHGEVELIVTSATTLEPRTLRQLEQAALKSEFVGQGQKLKVVPKVNPDIKGGLIVEIGDRTIDLSVSSKVSKMNQLLRDSL